MSLALRVLVGGIGTAAVAAGVMVIANALRSFERSRAGAAAVVVLGVLAGGIAAAGGAQLLRGALRGRMRLRQNRSRGSAS